MDFKLDLANISMVENLDLHHLVEVYNHNLAEILDKYAPLKSKTLKITHIQPWFNDKKKWKYHLGEGWNGDDYKTLHSTTSNHSTIKGGTLLM